MTATIQQFNNPPKSSFVYLDTSFILRIIRGITGQRQSHAIQCQSFFQILLSQVIANNTVLVTSDFAISEACFFIIQWNYKLNMPFQDSQNNRTYSDKHKWRQDFYRNRPDFISVFQKKLDDFFLFIENVPLLVLDSQYYTTSLRGMLYKQVHTFITRYFLLPTDAYHIAIGNAAGVTDFVAIDRDWKTIVSHWNESLDFNLYTCI